MIMFSRTKLASFLVAFLALGSCSCSSSADAVVYDLTSGSSIKTSVSEAGPVEIAVTIPAGQTGAGTWTTNYRGLLSIAREARNSLGEAGTAVSIDVDKRGELVGFTIKHSASAR